MARATDVPAARVIVSACLLGAPVRYHGGDARAESDVLRRWQQEGRIVALCPEVAGGLGTPRPPAELQGGDGVQVLRGRAAVRTQAGVDVTAAYLAGAAQAVCAARDADVRVAVLKSGSPSCGADGIYDGTFSGLRTAGAGVTAAALREAGVQVFDETQFDDADAVLAAIERGRVLQPMSTAGPAAITATPRLVLRCLSSDDAPFILALLNEPSFLRHIGDKGVRSLEDARAYIAGGPQASYARFGFGLYLVELKETQAAIGLCGLLKREELEDADIGFAFLPAYWSQGYAAEAARAVLAHARGPLRLSRIVAVVSPANDSSTRLLQRLGFTFERTVRLGESGSDLHLFASMPAAATAKMS